MIGADGAKSFVREASGIGFEDQGFGERWPVDAAAAAAAWAGFAHRVETPAAPGPAARLHCSDPDDQKFLELAQASGARWLVSRDNELLKLAPRCARDALFWIGLPQAWSLRKG